MASTVRKSKERPDQVPLPIPEPREAWLLIDPKIERTNQTKVAAVRILLRDLGIRLRFRREMEYRVPLLVLEQKEWAGFGEIFTQLGMLEASKIGQEDVRLLQETRHR